MRLGIFSDVHANLEALQAVLNAYQEQSIDRYVCLGDIVGYGANPNECCQVVREVADIVIMGNHDAACSGFLSPEWFNPAARTAVLMHRQMLDEGHLRWLAELPYRAEIDDMWFCHGSPYQQEDFPYILDEIDVELVIRNLAERPPLVFVGHTHRGVTFVVRERPTLKVWKESRERVRLLSDASYIFNVGSVGQPRDGDWRASYAIFDTTTRLFELRRTPYDIDGASGKIERLGLPSFLSERLYVGE
jgi:diadenosine tetraphosphatase ApaH/serine/threonine PP2A family protein phosphatase